MKAKIHAITHVKGNEKSKMSCCPLNGWIFETVLSDVHARATHSHMSRSSTCKQTNKKNGVAEISHRLP